MASADNSNTSVTEGLEKAVCVNRFLERRGEGGTASQQAHHAEIHCLNTLTIEPPLSFSDAIGKGHTAVERDLDTPHWGTPVSYRAGIIIKTYPKG